MDISSGHNCTGGFSSDDDNTYLSRYITSINNKM